MDGDSSGRASIDDPSEDGDASASPSKEFKSSFARSMVHSAKRAKSLGNLSSRQCENSMDHSGSFIQCSQRDEITKNDLPLTNGPTLDYSIQDEDAESSSHRPINMEERIPFEKLKEGCILLGINLSTEAWSQVKLSLCKGRDDPVKFGDFISTVKHLTDTNNSSQVYHESTPKHINIQGIRDEVTKLKYEINNKDVVCKHMEEDILKIRKECQRLLDENRKLRKEVNHLQAQLPSSRSTLDAKNLQKQVELLTVQLEKAHTSKHAYECAAEKLISFLEQVQATLSKLRWGSRDRTEAPPKPARVSRTSSTQSVNPPYHHSSSIARATSLSAIAQAAGYNRTNTSGIRSNTTNTSSDSHGSGSSSHGSTEHLASEAGHLVSVVRNLLKEEGLKEDKGLIHLSWSDLTESDPSKIVNYNSLDRKSVSGIHSLSRLKTSHVFNGTTKSSQQEPHSILLRVAGPNTKSATTTTSYFHSLPRTRTCASAVDSSSRGVSTLSRVPASSGPSSLPTNLQMRPPLPPGVGHWNNVHRHSVEQQHVAPALGTRVLDPHRLTAAVHGRGGSLAGQLDQIGVERRKDVVTRRRSLPPSDGKVEWV